MLKIAICDDESTFLDNIEMFVKKYEKERGTQIFLKKYLSGLDLEDSLNLKFDIVFLDPPYSKNMLQKALPKLPGKMNKGGVIICESPKDEILPENIENFHIYKRYRYGKICITVYRESQD